MKNSNNLLLLLIGVMVVFLVAVELVPLPEQIAPTVAPATISEHPKAAKFGSGAVSSVNVISSTALITLTVT